MGFAQILDIQSASITARQGNGLILPDFEVRPCSLDLRSPLILTLSPLQLLIDGAKIELALCADTMSSLQAFVADLSSAPAFQSKQCVPLSPPLSRLVGPC